MNAFVNANPSELTRWALNAEKMYAAAESFDEKRRAKIICHAIEQFADHDNPMFLSALRRMKRTPWTIDEFLDSKEFLNGSEQEDAIMEIWPNLKIDIRAMNPDVMIGEPPVHEALLGGATGTGKSVAAQVTTLNQALLLTCFHEPQRLFRRAPSMQIVFMLSSVSLMTVHRAIYTPMRHIWAAMPYVKKWVPYDRRKESMIDMEGNIVIAPALASIQAMIGQAIIGGAWDEINFMSIIEQSKMVSGPTGQGGRWDQAQEVYTTASRRRKSRFTTDGPSFGCLVVSSSTRYEGDFLDRRIAQVTEFNEPNIYAIRRKQYEVQPGYENKPTFRLLVGCDAYPTQVLKEEGEDGYENQHIPDDAQIEHVPVNYKFEFLKDPENALRDVVGIATKAITPFITQRHKLIDGTLDWKDEGYKQLLIKQNVDLLMDGMPQINEKNLPKDLDAPRAVHIDLSETSDRCGIAMARVHDYVDVIEMDHLGREMVITQPRYAVEFALSIQPHTMKRLTPGDVRKWVLQLAQFYGFNIASVTYDGFQSSESVGLLRKAGVRASFISMDTTTEPYEYLRSAAYEDRLLLPDNDLLRLELISLEWTKEKTKLDHPPKGSKDIADAVAGAVFALSRMRQTQSKVRATTEEGDVRIKREVRGQNTRQRGQRLKT